MTHHGGMTTGSAGQRVQSTSSVPPESEWSSGRARSLLLRAAVTAATALVSFAVVAGVALGSATGQRLDRRAMDALSSPQRTTHRLVEVLSLVSAWSVALVLAGCVVLALLRRRVAAAVAAMVLVAGANVTTQVLKYDVLTRPDIGFGTANTLPSGHTTVAVSLALAGVLVAPVALRGVVALLGSGVRPSSGRARSSAGGTVPATSWPGCRSACCGRRSRWLSWPCCGVTLPRRYCGRRCRT